MKNLDKITSSEMQNFFNIITDMYYEEITPNQAQFELKELLSNSKNDLGQMALISMIPMYLKVKQNKGQEVSITNFDDLDYKKCFANYLAKLLVLFEEDTQRHAKACNDAIHIIDLEQGYDVCCTIEACEELTQDDINKQVNKLRSKMHKYCIQEGVCLQCIADCYGDIHKMWQVICKHYEEFDEVGLFTPTKEIEWLKLENRLLKSDLESLRSSSNKMFDVCIQAFGEGFKNN